MDKLILAILLLPLSSHAQSPQHDSTARAEVNNVIMSYIKAYNVCDVEKMISLNRADVEVYTDFAGLTSGAAAVKQQLKNFCNYTAAIDQPTIELELAGELVTHILLTKDDKIYGAIVQGTLINYMNDKRNGKKQNAGTNDIFMILSNANNRWLISRDITFNTRIKK